MSKDDFSLPTLYQKLNYTSDHACQNIVIEVIKNNDSILKFKCSSWNLLNQGNPYNNPYKHVENLAEYNQRKKLQLDQLKSKIHNQDDFIILQEIDYFLKFLNHETENLEDKQFNEFIQFLVYEGYNIEITPENSAHGIFQVQLAIIYNKSKFEFIADQSKSCFYQEQITANKILKDYRGYQFCFKDITTGFLINITNVHLFFRTDSDVRIKDHQELLDYQLQQINQNIFTVIAGDTNNPRHSLAIGDPNQLTCFGLDDGKVITTTHWDTELIKSYDNFFISPTHETHAKIIETTECEYWQEISAQKSILKNDLEPQRQFEIKKLKHHKQYITEIGKPFANDSYNYNY